MGSIFIGVIIVGCQRHKFQMLSIFLPANTSFFLALLLVPIELISYIFKPISLGVRLFANLMAGHTLKSYCWFFLEFTYVRRIIFYCAYNSFIYFNSISGFRVRCCFNSGVCLYSVDLYLFK